MDYEDKKKATADQYLRLRGRFPDRVMIIVNKSSEAKIGDLHRNKYSSSSTKPRKFAESNRGKIYREEEAESLPVHDPNPSADEAQEGSGAVSLRQAKDFAKTR